MLNFGGNVSFTPRHVYTPAGEDEVLAILDRHAHGTVRVAGALHAWSDAVATDDVVIDLRQLARVHVETDASGQLRATVGGGCTLARVVDELREQAGAALPTIGAVMQQTIAGAISTGTHGSGGPSLSHWIEAVRVAAYDPATGRARIFEFVGGDELRAARCALGCMGVVLSVRLRCRREYWVSEMISHDRTLEAVLARRAEYPLQQFMLIPYAWQYVAFNRREADAPGARTRLWSRAYRLYDVAALEIAPHQLLSRVLLRASKDGRPSALIRRFLQHVLPRFFRAPRTTLPSMAALTLHTKHHASVRHVEMELFIPEPRLDYAVRLLRAVLEWSAGTTDAVPDALRSDVEGVGLGEELAAARGRYMQHYPLFFRRVRADDTLISMTSGGTDYYTISLFTYLPEEQRRAFYALCALVARALVRLTDARLHWGKYFPLALDDVAARYPDLAAFRRHCVAVDPRSVFVNDYAQRVLGLSRAAGDGGGGA